MTKRPYSREFPRQANSKNYALQGIPAGLLRAARAQAKRDHVSLRVVLLRALQRYVETHDDMRAEYRVAELSPRSLNDSAEVEEP